MSPSTSAELVLIAPSDLMLLIVTRPVALRGVGTAVPTGSDEMYITVLGEFGAGAAGDLSSTVNLNES